jgi:hypothetical protein
MDPMFGVFAVYSGAVNAECVLTETNRLRTWLKIRTTRCCIITSAQLTITLHENNALLTLFVHCICTSRMVGRRSPGPHGVGPLP